MTDSTADNVLQQFIDLTTQAIETLTDTDSEQAELLSAMAEQVARLAGGLTALIRAVVASDTLDAGVKQTLALELKWLIGPTP